MISPRKQSSSSTLLALLRKETSSHHRELDEHISVKAITSSREDYLAYLTNFCAAFLEANLLVNWPLLLRNQLPDFEKRQERYINLMTDILELNQSANPNPPLPTHNEDSPSSLATTAGALYVLEGSVHGGAQIHKRLEANLPSLRPTEFTFLQGFGPDTMKFWQRYCSWMNEIEFSQAEREQACQAAITTFAIFQKHFLTTSPQS